MFKKVQKIKKVTISLLLFGRNAPCKFWDWVVTLIWGKRVSVRVGDGTVGYGVG